MLISPLATMDKVSASSVPITEPFGAESVTSPEVAVLLIAISPVSEVTATVPVVPLREVMVTSPVDVIVKSPPFIDTLSTVMSPVWLTFRLPSPVIVTFRLFTSDSRMISSDAVIVRVSAVTVSPNTMAPPELRVTLPLPTSIGLTITRFSPALRFRFTPSAVSRFTMDSVPVTFSVKSLVIGSERIRT